MQLETWLLYTLAAIGLSLSPGPNSLLAMTHGALHGTRATTNPKGILFFAAFLPQFIDPARSLLLQFVVMAGKFSLGGGLPPNRRANNAPRHPPPPPPLGQRLQPPLGGRVHAGLA